MSIRQLDGYLRLRAEPDMAYPARRPYTPRMRIVVLVRQVPCAASGLSFNADNTLRRAACARSSTTPTRARSSRPAHRRRPGWCPPHRRVDHIAKAIHPLLYLALGVSGSVRHRAGMQGAQTIVAVDRDPEAPIFGVADLGVLGDARDVAKELLTEIQRRRERRRK